MLPSMFCLHKIRYSFPHLILYYPHSPKPKATHFWPEFRHIRRSTALRSGPWKTKPPEASPDSPGLRGWPLTRRSRPAWKSAGGSCPNTGARPRSRPQRDGLRLQGSGTPRGGRLHHGKQPAVTGPHAAARDAPQSRRGFRSSRPAPGSPAPSPCTLQDAERLLGMTTYGAEFLP